MAAETSWHRYCTTLRHTVTLCQRETARTGDVGLVLGARDAALLRRVVAVEVVDGRAVAGLVSVRTVGAGLRRRRSARRRRLDASRHELAARLAALVAEVGWRAAVRRHSDRRAPRRLVAVLAVCAAARKSI